MDEQKPGWRLSPSERDGQRLAVWRTPCDQVERESKAALGLDGGPAVPSPPYIGNHRQVGVPPWAWDVELEVPEGYRVEDSEVGPYLRRWSPAAQAWMVPAPGRLARDLAAANPEVERASRLPAQPPMASTTAEAFRLGARPLLTTSDGPRMGWASYDDM